MTAMCQKLAFPILVVIIHEIAVSFGLNPCDEKNLTEFNGTVSVNIDDSRKEVICKWLILSPGNTITAFRLLETRIDYCYPTNSCCLTISGYQPFCNENLKTLVALSLRKYPITIVLSALSGIELKFEYSTRSATQCPQHDFECSDKSNCFNYHEICNDQVICEDYSDKRGCGKCDSNSTWCGGNSDNCFELSQRCDGNLNCPMGEDELNCEKDCTGIKCPNEGICINQDQLCDDVLDCRTGFDEGNCINIRSSNSFNIIITFLVCSVCSLLFFYLIYRWMTTRRDLNRILQNLPEFPLAPFQGPGDQDEDTIDSSDILDVDIRPGGEIYESYMASLKKKTVSTKAVQAGTGKYSHLELDGDNELVALASLGVPTHLCVGLTVSEDSITSLTNSKRSGKSENDEQKKKVTGEDLTGLKTKIIYRKDLELITKKGAARRGIRSAPLSSRPTRSELSGIISSFTDTPICGNPASSPNISAISQPNGSQSDDLLHSLCKKNPMPRQILVKPYITSMSDSSQWTDIEEFPITHKVVNIKKAKENNEQKRKIGKSRISFTYKKWKH